MTSKKIYALAFLALFIGLTTLSALAQKTPKEHPAIVSLKKWLALPENKRKSLSSQAFAIEGLSKQDAQIAADLLYQDRLKQIKLTYAKAWESRTLQLKDLKMPFYIKEFGTKPASGRSLYISMHGGGGAPASVNDQQWDNQKMLYTPEEGIYLAPRAPGNTWDLWHQGHVDEFFELLIPMCVAFADVNPDKVYLLGYSAGGDGVYQLAPRLAYRFAAASMMAGHPNEAKPLGLRNLPISLWMGELDDAYNRNKVIQTWNSLLDSLQKLDKEGYVHQMTLVKGKGHWMELQDKAALPWMAQFTRTACPKRLVWYQDDVLHKRFYWLQAPEPAAGQTIIAEIKGNQIFIEKSDAKSLIINVNDSMLDMDKEIEVIYQGKTVFKHKAIRCISVLQNSLAACNDKNLAFSASLLLAL